MLTQQNVVNFSTTILMIIRGDKPHTICFCLTYDDEADKVSLNH